MLTHSEKRKQILLFLLDSDQTLETIRTTFGYTATGVLPQIRILEYHGLIQQVDRFFTLTPLGRTCVSLLAPLVQMTNFLDNHDEYWRTHLISEIPADLLARIYELGKVSVLTARADDLFVSREEFKREVKDTNCFQGMSAMVHPHHLELFYDIATKGSKITHILSPGAAQTLIRVYPEKIKNLLSIKKDCFLICQKDFPWECVLTDKAVFFSLFTTDRMADPYNDLYSQETSAKKWASDLFHRYLSCSDLLIDIE